MAALSSATSTSNSLSSSLRVNVHSKPYGTVVHYNNHWWREDVYPAPGQLANNDLKRDRTTKADDVRTIITCTGLKTS